MPYCVTFKSYPALSQTALGRISHSFMLHRLQVSNHIGVERPFLKCSWKMVCKIFKTESRKFRCFFQEQEMLEMCHEEAKLACRPETVI